MLYVPLLIPSCIRQRGSGATALSWLLSVLMLACSANAYCPVCNILCVSDHGAEPGDASKCVTSRNTTMLDMLWLSYAGHGRCKCIE